MAITRKIPRPSDRKAPRRHGPRFVPLAIFQRLFAEDFLTDSLDEDSNELGNLLAQIEAFSGSAHSGTSDLFKFRELLLEAAHSVFMRWKVLHQLRTMALTDELTSLYNRRGFLLLGMHYLRLARRTAPLSLYLADVDGLKIVNDCCGHVQGDALLVACGEVLKATFRESDIIARIGGDEFAVLAQGGTSESRDAVLCRLQSSIDIMNRDVLPSYRLSLKCRRCQIRSVESHHVRRASVCRRS